MPKLTRSKFLLTCFLSLFATISLAYGFGVQDIPTYTLRYAVAYKGSAIGELEIRIEKSAEKVIVHGETFPNMLANFFGDGKVIETIEYTQHGKQLLLSRLTERKGRKNPDIKQLEVDRKKGKLITQKGQFSIAKDEQIDAYTFPLLSILGLSDARQGSQERLVSADKVRRYQYHSPSKETISTPAGTFKTIKKSKTRTDNNKTIILWLTETQPIMPVKIQIVKKGRREATITLINSLVQ